MEKIPRLVRPVLAARPPPGTGRWDRAQLGRGHRVGTPALQRTQKLYSRGHSIEGSFNSGHSIEGSFNMGHSIEGSFNNGHSIGII